jgi:hypothetical protein
MVGGVAVREVRRVLPLARQEHALPGHEDAVEDADAGRLAVLRREERRLVAGAPGGPGDDGQPVGVDRHGAADREVGIGLGHRPAGHDEELVHVGRAGDDRLGPREDDPLRVPLDDVHVRVGVALRVRTQAAVALGVGHGDAEREIAILDRRAGRP